MVALIGAPLRLRLDCGPRRTAGSTPSCGGDRARESPPAHLDALSTSVPASAGERYNPSGGPRVPTGRIPQVSRSDAPQPDSRAPTGGAAVTEEAVLAALRGVVDPELGADIVELGMVSGRADRRRRRGRPSRWPSPWPGARSRTQIRSDVETHVGAVPGVRTVSVDTGVMDADQRKAVMARARQLARGPGAGHRHPRHRPGDRRRLGQGRGRARARSPSTWPWPWPAGG